MKLLQFRERNTWVEQENGVEMVDNNEDRFVGVALVLLRYSRD